jgi:hypothetical protein
MRGLEMGRIYKTVRVRYCRKAEYVVAFVDSGADTCVISQRLARRLKMRMPNTSKVIVADGRQIPTRTDIITIESPNEKVKVKLTVDITDLPFDEDIDILDMILGIDFLQETESMLEFHHGGKKSLCRART